MSTVFVSARQSGLVNCHDCHLLSRVQHLKAGQAALCPRCGAPLRSRKSNSLVRTWALIIAAAILYVPANILPITITTSWGNQQADTIMTGVIYFIKTGSFGVALVIFIASIFVPLMKLLILTSLLVSVQFKSAWRPKDRTRLYRITEAVGRWSMLDIYVVTIMVALIKLGALANIDAGPAAIYFAAVVILTMFAAESFDPRLIWDALELKHE